jgi:GH18 family chitinase
LASYDDKAKSGLFASDQAMEALVKDLLNLVAKAGADGITLDFGYLKNKDKQGFTSFARDLGIGLTAMDTSFKLNVVLSPVLCSIDSHFAYDMEELDKYIGFFLLTGFDYYNKNSKVPGPNAPLFSGDKWFPHDINASTLKYLSLGIPDQKLILVVPFFGKQWVTIDRKLSGFAKTLNYNEFDAQIRTKSQRVFDTVSLTPVYFCTEKDKTFQTWIDDSVSVALKCNYIKANHLGGVGVWGLGYDSKNNELTSVIVKKFYLINENKTNNNMTMDEVLTDMGTLEKTLWTVDLGMLFLLLSILILSFKICLVRSLVNRFLYFFYALGFILFIVTYFLIRETNYIENDGSIAIIAFIIIVSLIMIKTMHDNNARKDYP